MHTRVYTHPHKDLSPTHTENPKVTLDFKLSSNTQYKSVLNSIALAELLLFSCPVVSNSLRPHGLQHARPPCPSPSPGVHPSSCPLHQWCHPAISSSDTLFLPSVFPSIRDFSNESAPGKWVTKILELQHESFQWIFRVDFLSDWLVWLSYHTLRTPPLQIRGGSDKANPTTMKSCLPLSITQNTSSRDFPGGPVVRALHFHCRGHGIDPCSGN